MKIEAIKVEGGFLIPLDEAIGKIEREKSLIEQKTAKQGILCLVSGLGSAN